jgi:hypothetical protein
MKNKQTEEDTSEAASGKETTEKVSLNLEDIPASSVLFCVNYPFQLIL